MATLGQDLRRERELRSVSLQEISDATKINLRLLEAVEQDRWKALPGEFFVKGVLRAYARTIGLDEEDIVDRFHQETMGEAEARGKAEESGKPVPDGRGPAKPSAPVKPAAPVVPTPPVKPEPPAKKPRGAPRWILAGGIALLAVLLGGGAYLVVKLSRPPVLPALPAAPASVPLVAAPAFEPAAVTVPKPEIVERENHGIRLELSFLAETWIHAAADGVVVFVGNKPAGSKAVWTAETEIILQTGNAGGMTLAINGRQAKPLGRSGEVRTDIRIGLDNYLSFLAEPEIRAAEST